eukprot:CAMPEP_0170197432 /NCGR_PEP_ID=MMETSP0040_2-20121228/66369_1 /TAXON_ID=641309 /ORGANISM="Lotharella oceanica, Strain CCMP622" /LENGTH=355 /DNA_ID=CAMNT_0010447101 /DNA_START=63 /DNA_END=1131 /DNA_ORIENTATION=-
MARAEKSSNTPSHNSMFRFVGRLMGMGMRTCNLLSINLSPIVWKGLVREEVDELDVADVDEVVCRHIAAVRDFAVDTTCRAGDEKKRSDREAEAADIFNKEFGNLRFTTVGCDNVEYEVVSDGKELKLSWANRMRYVTFLRRFKLTEYEQQVSEMRTGLCEVVPGKILSILTWAELRARVAGAGATAEDMEILAKNTDYHGCSASDPFIKRFWTMLRSLTDEQRSDFLKFVWGRSRLPPRGEPWRQRFSIHAHGPPRAGGGGADAGAEANPTLLPVAHTCIFKLCLPRYATLSIMRDKVLLAVQNCMSVDIDGEQANEGAALLPWEDDEHDGGGGGGFGAGGDGPLVAADDERVT